MLLLVRKRLSVDSTGDACSGSRVGEVVLSVVDVRVSQVPGMVLGICGTVLVSTLT